MSEQGWVMLTAKLPTSVSPPKMSVHWAIPWPNMSYAAAQAKRLGEDYDVEADRFVDELCFGFEGNWARARAIFYRGEKLRIFPHEFSVLKPENMRLYVEEGAIELVEDDLVTRYLGDRSLKTRTQHEVYGAALVDGCDHWQAMMVALGEDPFGGGEFPPVGWWRMTKAYADYFCYEEEQQE